MERNKKYWITSTTKSGFTESYEVDKDDLRRLIATEQEDAVAHRTNDGRVVMDYGFRVNNIVTNDITGRDVEFFAPGVSKVDKYTNKAVGYFIKDTRSNFKVLAPGTDDILVFSSRKDASEYYNTHLDQIEWDYIQQKDAFFETSGVIYESSVYSHSGNLNLTGKGSMFPRKDIYTSEDLAALRGVVRSYEDYNTRNEYAQNLKYIGPTFDNFVDHHAYSVGEDKWYMDLEDFDSGFKPMMEHFVKSYPEMVNRDVRSYKMHEYLRDRQNAMESARQRFEDMADERGLTNGNAGMGQDLER